MLLCEDMFLGEEAPQSLYQVIKAVVGRVRRFRHIGLVRQVRLDNHRPPRIQRQHTKPHTRPRKQQIPPKLHPHIIGIKIDSQQYQYQRRHPADKIGKTHREVVTVRIAVLVRALHRPPDFQSFIYRKQEIGEEDDAHNTHHPHSPAVAHMHHPYSLQKHGDERQNRRQEEDEMCLLPMLRFFTGEKVSFTHDEHLDGEEEQRESVDIQQRITVAYPQQVRNFKHLQQVNNTHSLLCGEEFVEMLGIGLGAVEPLQQPAV